MGALKDLIDLVTQLDASIKDRKQRDLFLPLKEKIVDVKAEMLELKEEHSAAIETLKTEHAKAVNELQTQLAKLLGQRPQAEFVQKTGTYLDAFTGQHYCPRCWHETPPRVSPMQSMYYGWLCGVCNKACTDPDRPRSHPMVHNPSPRESRW